MDANGVKKLKRGEVLFKEGDAPSGVYMIQSGKLGLMLERGAKRLEIATLGPSQVVGEAGLFSTAKQEFTAEALQETKLLEVPLEMMKQQFEKSPPGVKLMMKSLITDMAQTRKQMKTIKMESEKTPCPQGLIHRIFTQLHLIARHIGKKDAANPDVIILSWNAFKLYSTRFFGESPQRMRSLMDLLFKLKMAELKIEKPEDSEAEELTEVRLSRVQVYEDFAEFYQYHLFKGSRAEAIFVDALALKAAKAIYELSEGAEVDHKGASKVDYGKLVNDIKAKFHFELKNTHLDSLERKGLFAVRKAFDDGRVELSFDRTEFGKMSQFWAIIHEIDKWNEKGIVDLNEKEEVQASAGGCPQCNSPTDDKSKFCSNCGCKLQAAA